MNSGAGRCVQHCERHRLQEGSFLLEWSLSWSACVVIKQRKWCPKQKGSVLMLRPIADELCTLSPRPVHCGWHHLWCEPDLPQASWRGAHAELHLLWPGPGEMEVWSCWWVTGCPHLLNTRCGSVETGMEKLVCELGTSLCPLSVLNCTNAKIEATLLLLEGKWKGIS